MKKIHSLTLILFSLVITLTVNANDEYKHEALDKKSRDFICNTDNLPLLMKYGGNLTQNIGITYLSVNIQI